MAICKEIEQEDGVVTGYHRVLFVQNTPNSHVSVAVLSLVDGSARTREKAGEIEGAYARSVTFETEDVDEMTVREAYEWLKTLPAFEGAQDC